MPKSNQVFRMTISDMQILGTIEALSHYKSIYGLNADANKLLTDFQKKALEINNGVAIPAYVTTGIRKESAINLISLGADTPLPVTETSSTKSLRTEDDINKDNIIADKMMELMSEGLDLDEAQSQAEEWYMKGCNTGTNSASTVLHDPDISTDNDSIHTFLMQNQTLTTDQF